MVNYSVQLFCAVQAAANAASDVANAVQTVAEAVVPNATEVTEDVSEGANITDGSDDDPNGAVTFLLHSHHLLKPLGHLRAGTKQDRFR